MSSGINVIIYHVQDLARSKALFSTFLGAEPSTDSPYYVGFELDGQQIGLVPDGQQGGTNGPVCFRDVPDIAAAHQALVAAGAESHEEPHDVGGGLLVGSVKDTDGNVIGLRQQP
ncbi:VOC family protein [Streptomyces sp. SL13]|uniref:VOC family protein n=1 Tax=Streptantibioticus silvisoli TaxID=2705255 RepID=A0AA90HEB9_9ACTN|nr:VOC family protein [Streptantibioticus silvisoli]MDI5961399.1 VOC family protein [Streptantibioticus silvisoli]MDI5973342.1 VOC family protein [Streptantibioticus silvisoli]